MSLNLHHVRIFTAIVEHGGFTKAAQVLRLSQPAVSKSLTELERQLHVTLLDRSGKSVVLTEAGRTLFARAGELFDWAEQVNGNFAYRERMWDEIMRLEGGAQ